MLGRNEPEHFPKPCAKISAARLARRGAIGVQKGSKESLPDPFKSAQENCLNPEVALHAPNAPVLISTKCQRGLRR